LSGKLHGLSGTLQRPIFIKLGHEVVRCPIDEFGNIFENFHFRGQNLTWKLGQTGTSLSRLQVTGCIAVCLLCAVVQGRGSFRGLVNFSVQRTIAELRGIKVAQFSDFGLFSPYKTPTTYPPVTSLQLRGYIAELLRFFHEAVEGPKGCLLAAMFSCAF